MTTIEEENKVAGLKIELIANLYPEMQKRAKNKYSVKTTRLLLCMRNWLSILRVFNRALSNTDIFVIVIL